MYRYIYGPVPSRRLGISLGIDMVPHKTCTLDCIYCECGGTTDLTTERAEYISIRDILAELRDYLTKNPAPEYVSLSGSGEPTLNSGIGELIAVFKREYPHIPLAVLTNGTLLYRKDVRGEILASDLVLPSLDSACAGGFGSIDKPAPELDLNAVIDGIALFRDEYKAADVSKQVWLEVFIVEGINTTPEEISALKQAINKIRPDRVQLNSLDRPGTDLSLKAPSMSLMERLRDELDPGSGKWIVEIVMKFKSRNEIASYLKKNEDSIVEAISRRPLTARDIHEVTGLHIHELEKYLDVLVHDKKVRPVIGGRGVFYQIISGGK
jgi:wyosine [tRNA(Phe)-imidazoG37] synthetase (radical SAM superfamily)